jgi:hypothetical protein
VFPSADGGHDIKRILILALGLLVLASGRASADEDLVARGVEALKLCNPAVLDAAAVQKAAQEVGWPQFERNGLSTLLANGSSGPPLGFMVNEEAPTADAPMRNLACTLITTKSVYEQLVKRLREVYGSPVAPKEGQGTTFFTKDGRPFKPDLKELAATLQAKPRRLPPGLRMINLTEIRSDPLASIRVVLWETRSQP